MACYNQFWPNINSNFIPEIFKFVHIIQQKLTIASLNNGRKKASQWWILQRTKNSKKQSHHRWEQLHVKLPSTNHGSPCWKFDERAVFVNSIFYKKQGTTSNYFSLTLKKVYERMILLIPSILGSVSNSGSM